MENSSENPEISRNIPENPENPLIFNWNPEKSSENLKKSLNFQSETDNNKIRTATHTPTHTHTHTRTHAAVHTHTPVDNK